nr:uncharacterized protein CTRU02_03996 [Colletotrichum truncatum]KAF6796036.1 hypothetical protein CTRU02_03996 [Colletotrichum truncatum]
MSRDSWTSGGPALAPTSSTSSNSSSRWWSPLTAVNTAIASEWQSPSSRHGKTPGRRRLAQKPLRSTCAYKTPCQFDEGFDSTCHRPHAELPTELPVGHRLEAKPDAFLWSPIKLVDSSTQATAGADRDSTSSSKGIV